MVLPVVRVVTAPGKIGPDGSEGSDRPKPYCSYCKILHYFLQVERTNFNCKILLEGILIYTEVHLLMSYFWLHCAV